MRKHLSFPQELAFMFLSAKDGLCTIVKPGDPLTRNTITEINKMFAE